MPITVNGVEIDYRAINIESANYEGGDILERQNQAAVALVVRELLLQEVEAQGITEPDPPDVLQEGYAEETQEDALIRTLLARNITTPDPDEQSCRTYYESNRERFRRPDVFEVSHILIPALPDDEEARDAAMNQARELLERARSAPETFEAVAREHSACPSASGGGSLGRIGPGQTVPEFEEQLALMVIGEVCPWIVETRYGFHVVRLDDRIAGQQLDFETVRQRIADYLKESVWRRAVTQYIQLLAAKAEMSGIDLEARETPLVQ